jgi:putative ABC transport system permease protein
LLRHPWQSVLMIVGIMLGVAVVVSIDLANTSASRAFELSTQAITGRATHQITGGPDGLDEAIYTRLRREGITRESAPIVTEYVSSPQLGDRPLQLLGVDPFAEPPFRSYLDSGPRQGTSQGDVTSGGLTDLLTRPGAILLSEELARQYHLTSGAPITIEIEGYAHAAFIAGLLKPSDDLSRRALDGMLLADVATAQELTGRLGKLDRIDLILRDDATAAHIRAWLPPGIRLSPVEARTGSIEQMTAAFRVNLTALSLMALIVGMFLIYNTMTFSVVQRRPLFGTLRCLGATRREVFILVVSEAFIVGVLGGVLGVGLGVVMGQGAVRAVTQTINDLYFAVSVTGVEIPVTSLVKGLALSICATVITAAIPAWEAATVPPRAALVRSSIEAKTRQIVMWAAVAGAGMFVVGAGVLMIPTRDLVLSLFGTFVIVMGFALLAPVTLLMLMRAASPLTRLAWGMLGRMAPRNVVNALSRTSIAVAALMVAVSVTIAVSLMVGSFRHTVIVWLGQTLRGDIYVSVPSTTATQAFGKIDPRALSLIQTWPGVARADTLRAAMVDSPNGPVHVDAINNPDLGDVRLFVWAEAKPAAIWNLMQSDAVIVSEPFANQFHLRRGSTVTLYADAGPHTFRVVGVYYDYASSQGTVIMAQPVYRRLWHDEAITAVSLRLAPNVRADNVTRELQDALGPIQRLLVRPNTVLRDEALAVFDRTFAITGALQILATVVAFIGVLSALLSLLLEKQRELGILRAMGLTVRELWGLVMLESGLMGAAAGVLAMPAGFALSVILIYIINRRSFGWTLQMSVGWQPFAQALAVAIVAALLAGIYPARRMGRMMAADALRFE